LRIVAEGERRRVEARLRRQAREAFAWQAKPFSRGY
jgi:hypothetical protein